MQISTANLPDLQPRSQGRAVLASAAGRLTELFQQGCMKILLPRHLREAVLVNTAGGLTGGDRLSFEARLGPGEQWTLTTQAAERIYRAASGSARLDQRITLDRGARLDWLPQEMILFNGAALERRLAVDLAEDAHFLGLESYIFGREAHGEVLTTLHLRDNWRIRRGGRLIHAEALRLDEMPQGAATLQGCRAAATLVLAAPLAADLLEAARALTPQGEVTAGVTAPLSDLLIARFLAPSGHALRKALIPILTHLREAPPPRVWQF